MMPITIEPIGYVSNDFNDEDMPRKRVELVSELVIQPHYSEALEGIEGYSHLFVIFWMHKVQPDGLRLRDHPRGRQDLPLTGVLATRGRQHPNPVGLAVVELLSKRDNRLQVKRLDAYNGTPVIDIKPYDDYDVFEDIRVPAWRERLTGTSTKNKIR